MTASSIADLIEARLFRLLAPPTSPLLRLMADGERIGLVTPERAQRLSRFECFDLQDNELVLTTEPSSRNEAMATVARTLASEGALTAWRDERYAARIAFDAPVRFEVERAAARYLGIRTFAAHVNGLVRSDRGVRMWLARRSATKAIDPGLLDNLVGGGIAAGATVEDTVVKESWEEAGIPAGIAASATCMAELGVFRLQPDGIQHESIYAHDLWLPPDWSPMNQDGEAVEHRLVSLDDAARIVASDALPDRMTADASLVALDCLVRLGAIADTESLARLRQPGLPNP